MITSWWLWLQTLYRSVKHTGRFVITKRSWSYHLKKFQSLFKWRYFKRPTNFSGLWRTGKNRYLSHTHRGPKVVLTACESFRSEISLKTKYIRNQHALRIMPVFTKLKSDVYRRSYGEKRENSPLLLCFELFCGQCLGGRTHTQTQESSSFLT